MSEPTPFPVSAADRERIGEILPDPKCDWWSAQFFRLVAKSDIDRRRQLRLSFPDHVDVVEQYLQMPSTKEAL